MNSNKCQKHQIRMNYLNCMKNECSNKVQCIKCHCEETKHHDDYVKQMMAINKMEMKKMFKQIVNEIG